MNIGCCEYCEKLFEAKNPRAKYCCDSHKVLAHYYKNKSKKEQKKPEEFRPKYDSKNVPGVAKFYDRNGNVEFYFRHGIVEDRTTYNRGNGKIGYEE